MASPYPDVVCRASRETLASVSPDKKCCAWVLILGILALTACRRRTDRTLTEYLESTSEDGEIKAPAFERRAPGTGVLIDRNGLETPFKEVKCAATGDDVARARGYVAEFLEDSPSRPLELRILVENTRIMNSSDELPPLSYQAEVLMSGASFYSVLTLKDNGKRGSVIMPRGVFYYQCFTTDHATHSQRKPRGTTWFDGCHDVQSGLQKLWCKLDPKP